MTGEAIALANPWEQIKARLTTQDQRARPIEDWVTRTAFRRVGRRLACGLRFPIRSPRSGWSRNTPRISGRRFAS